MTKTSLPNENSPSREIFKKPDDIIVGDLRYAWEANADPTCVQVSDTTIVHDLNLSEVFRDPSPQTYKNACLGPPAGPWKECVGIYTLKP